MAKGKAKTRYVVQCSEHGAESKAWSGRMVIVQKPKNKRSQMAGCPLCAAKKRAQAFDPFTSQSSVL